MSWVRGQQKGEGKTDNPTTGGRGGQTCEFEAMSNWHICQLENAKYLIWSEIASSLLKILLNWKKSQHLC